MNLWISSAARRLLAKTRVRSPRSDEVGHQLRGIGQRATSLPELLVEERRVPERDGPLGLRRSVVTDHREVEPDERVGELAGVADRRRGEQELRFRSVDAGQSPEAAQHVGDVRAEDAAVDVRLVHHDEAQVREDVAPAVVMWQDADVEHVRVGQDEVRPLPDLPAALALGVAVVDRRLDALDLQLVECPNLVLGERLRRIEVERTLLRLLGERGEHGQVEGEALPAGGAGGDDDVLAARRRVPGFGLVGVERVDPMRFQPLAKWGRQVGR